jgi:hypothetical protein
MYLFKDLAQIILLYLFVFKRFDKLTLLSMSLLFCNQVYISPVLSSLRIILAVILFFIKVKFLGNVRMTNKTNLVTNDENKNKQDKTSNYSDLNKRRNSFEEENIFINSVFYLVIRMKFIGKITNTIVSFIYKRENNCLALIFIFGVILPVELKLKIFCVVFLIIKPSFVMIRRYTQFSTN